MTTTAAPALVWDYDPWTVERLLGRVREMELVLAGGALPPLRLVRDVARMDRHRPLRSQRWEALARTHCDLWRGLDALPPWPHRQTIYRLYWLGESMSHIARITGCNRDTVGQDRRDGIEHMAAVLGWAGDPRPWREQRRRSPVIWRAWE